MRSAAARGRNRAALRRALALVVPAIAVAALVFGLRTSAAATPCTSSPVVCENQLPGVAASSWIPSGSGDASIQGFATNISVDHGQTIDFKVKSPASYRVEIYRFGYYGGLGSRLV